jgi:hypothetical protein
LDRGFSSFSKLNFPPKTCIPSSAKIMMNRNRRRMREAIDWIELSNDATRFDSDLQYLPSPPQSYIYIFQLHKAFQDIEEISLKKTK